MKIAMLTRYGALGANSRYRLLQYIPSFEREGHTVEVRPMLDDAYLRESVLDPGAKIVAGYDNIMPTFQGVVSEDQLLQLLAYVKSIGSQPAQDTTGEAGPAAPAGQ